MSTKNTPFDPKRLANIIGASAAVASNVVTVSVGRREHIHIDGVLVQPQAKHFR